jgi:SAM-dependent methyltransferase
MAAPTDPWNDPAFLRDVQYRTDANLAARQSIYAYQHPRIDLQARVIDLAAPAPGETVADVGCGNGAYLAELARRGFGGRVLGLDMSLGMLAAARERLISVGPVGAKDSLGAADRADGRWGRRERLTLDNGEVLARSCFSTVARPDFVTELRVPGPQPIADYVRSMSGTQHDADPERLVAAVVSRLPSGPGAVLTITTHTGCLICKV